MLQKVFPWQFLLEIILHQPLILGKIEMVSVVTLFKFSITNGKHFINNLSLIVDMLKQSVPSDREHRWQLFDVWFNLMSTLFDKIMKVCVCVCLFVCVCLCVCLCVRDEAILQSLISIHCNIYYCSTNNINILYITI